MSDMEKGQSSQSATVNATPPAQAAYNGQHGFTPISHTPRPTGIGNPGALGLFSFASTTFMLSLYNVGAHGVSTPNVIVGMALFTGGLAQLLAGMWEFPRGNQFGGTAFVSYGAFWMSYATILIPSSGIATAYATKQELDNAIGIYLEIWFVFTSLLLIGAIRRNITFILLLFFLALTFLILGVGSFTGSASVNRAGGALGIITAWIAYYAGVSELLVREESYWMPPLGALPRRLD
ncbi:hypothetical protein PLICRDRAFT_432556 [Plicaturopsis crispa FD-325 SS-3]|uniref:FUN34 transmembrane protein n=1 Tax=Plicaturopsis crispa FD-325 SS-3 TaxID=944288 RepID=A0A0C9SKL3_PLICR|nr:hypothetical protein PLICRDRAFT_432556 [Plicaturopsis crispa FD-325 SS-3]